MPAPPPPSKSYLICITDSDLSSDDDDNVDEYTRRRLQHQKYQQQQTHQRQEQEQQQQEEQQQPPQPVFRLLARDSNSYPDGERIRNDNIQSHITSIRTSCDPAAATSATDDEGKTPDESHLRDKTSTPDTFTGAEEDDDENEEVEAGAVVVDPTEEAKVHKDAYGLIPIHTQSQDNPEEQEDDGDEADDDDDENDDDVAASPGPSKGKRNRKRKKNKKRKKKTTNNTNVNNESITAAMGNELTQTTTTNTDKKNTKKERLRIRFGDVSIRNHERCLGVDAVPLDGGWPLGLGSFISSSKEDDNANANSNTSSCTTLSIDEYETAKHERLAQRWKKWHGQVMQPAVIKDQDDADKKEPSQQDQDESVPSVLETRQWDYKQGVKNPLFSLLIEKQRMALLLGEKSLDELFEEKYEKNHNKKKKQQPQQEKKKATTNTTSSPPSKKNKKNHKLSSSSSSSSCHVTTRRSRSGSQNNMQNQERYNDEFSKFEVHHVRNELETLRNFRTQREAHGCTCRKLDVYIPPPNAGKKAAHRRLNVNKVKEELRKRHALPERNCTREELELLLHDLVAQEPCCRDENCPCVKNGIGCQSDTCQCWLASHQHKSSSSSSSSSSHGVDEITPSVIESRCGNKFGMYTVDLQGISMYRKNYLTYCRPVTT